MEGKLLSKDEILNAVDVKFEDVPVPEWGGRLARVKCMTGAERDEYEGLLYDFSENGVKMKRENYRAKLLVYTIVNEDMTRMFTVKEIEELSKKSAKAIDRLFTVAQRLNGLSKEEIEKIEKNSGPVAGEGSILS